MPSLPRKARNGDDFKSYTTSAINKLIDYLHSMRVRPGTGIDVQETASGVVISAIGQKASAPQVEGGGGGASGLVATVSGGTASVAVSGSSPLVIEAGQNVTITCGTNGEVIIGSTASGGGGVGFPDYSQPIALLDYTSAGSLISYNQDVWLIGYVRLFVSSSTSTAQITLEFQTGGFQYILGNLTGPISGDGLSVSYPVAVPIKANTSFRFIDGYPPGSYSTISADFLISVLPTL